MASDGKIATQQPNVTVDTLVGIVERLRVGELTYERVKAVSTELQKNLVLLENSLKIRADKWGQRLPKPLVKEILTNLDAKDVVRAGRVNPSWASELKNDNLWLALFQNKWGYLSSHWLNAGLPFLQVYQIRQRVDEKWLDQATRDTCAAVYATMDAATAIQHHEKEPQCFVGTSKGVVHAFKYRFNPPDGRTFIDVLHEDDVGEDTPITAIDYEPHWSLGLAAYGERGKIALFSFHSATLKERGRYRRLEGRVIGAKENAKFPTISPETVLDLQLGGRITAIKHDNVTIGDAGMYFRNIVYCGSEYSGRVAICLLEHSSNSGEYNLQVLSRLITSSVPVLMPGEVLYYLPQFPSFQLLQFSQLPILLVGTCQGLFAFNLRTSKPVRLTGECTSKIKTAEMMQSSSEMVSKTTCLRTLIDDKFKDAAVEMSFARHSETLAFCDGDCCVRVWNVSLRCPDQTATLVPHSQEFELACTEQCVINFHHKPSLKNSKQRTFYQNNKVLHLRMMAGADKLWTITGFEILQIWDMKTGKELSYMEEALGWDKGPGTFISCVLIDKRFEKLTWIRHLQLGDSVYCMDVAAVARAEYMKFDNKEAKTPSTAPAQPNKSAAKAVRENTKSSTPSSAHEISKPGSDLQAEMLSLASLGARQDRMYAMQAQQNSAGNISNNSSNKPANLANIDPDAGRPRGGRNNLPLCPEGGVKCANTEDAHTTRYWHMVSPYLNEAANAKGGQSKKGQPKEKLAKPVFEMHPTVNRYTRPDLYTTTSRALGFGSSSFDTTLQQPQQQNQQGKLTGFSGPLGTSPASFSAWQPASNTSQAQQMTTTAQTQNSSSASSLSGFSFSFGTSTQFESLPPNSGTQSIFGNTQALYNPFSRSSFGSSQHNNGMSSAPGWALANANTGTTTQHSAGTAATLNQNQQAGFFSSNKNNNGGGFSLPEDGSL